MMPFPSGAAAVCDLIWLHQRDGGQQGTPQRMACTVHKERYSAPKERRLARTATLQIRESGRVIDTEDAPSNKGVASSNSALADRLLSESI